MPARTLQPETEPILAIQSVNPLMIDHPALPAQQDVDSEIAIAHPGLSKIVDAQPQCCLVGLGRTIANRRPIDAERDATAPFAHSVGRLNLPHEFAPPTRRQSFFDSTSCKMCLSRLRSATNCLSLRFSSSSCFRRRSSPVPSPL